MGLFDGRTVDTLRKERRMNEVGQRIHELRKTLGLSQNAFGARLGVSHAHISRIESGKENSSLTLQKLIVWEYGVNREWLLTGTGKMLDQWEGTPEKAGEEFPADEFTTIKIVLQHSKLHYLAINGEKLDDVLEFSITVGNKPTVGYQCVREIPVPRKYRIGELISKPQQIPDES